MRWCAALAVVLVALVVMTVRTIRRPHRHPPPADGELVDLAPPAPGPPGASFSPVVVPRESSGIAHVRGRVLFPAGKPGDDDISVVADDGTRTVDARVEKDGGYQLHLPSGRYTLIASAGKLVGVAPDVLARAGATRDIDIRLGAGAAITGRLRGPDGDVVVSASLVGRDDDSGLPRVDDDGGFQVGGLIPGRRYDLIFTGPAVRKRVITGVTAPADSLDVELQARAQISGAIGFPRGTICPIADVELQIDGKTVRDENDNEVSTGAGGECRFQLAVPDKAAAVTVVATGDGWHLEEYVAIPPTGDPEPICLNPPCRGDPMEGLARLQIALEGDEPDSPMSADVDPVSDADPSTHSCGGSDGRCDVEGLTPGATFTVKARGMYCSADPIEVTVAAGNNRVRVRCHRLRQIEGVIRTPDGEPPGSVTLRCQGGTKQTMTGRRLFMIICNADAPVIEYQVDPQGSWRSVPIASAADPAFVDISL